VLDLSYALKTSCAGLYAGNFDSAIATQHDTHTQHDGFIARSTGARLRERGSYNLVLGDSPGRASVHPRRLRRTR
jgi:hypothetical protein